MIADVLLLDERLANPSAAGDDECRENPERVEGEGRQDADQDNLKALPGFQVEVPVNPP